MNSWQVAVLLRSFLLIFSVDLIFVLTARSPSRFMSTWKTRDWNWSKVSVRRPRLVCSGRSSAPSATRHVSSSSADSSSPPSNGGSSVLTARAKLVHFRTWAPELVGRDPDGGHDPPGFFFSRVECESHVPTTARLWPAATRRLESGASATKSATSAASSVASSK